MIKHRVRYKVPVNRNEKIVYHVFNLTYEKKKEMLRDIQKGYAVMIIPTTSNHRKNASMVRSASLYLERYGAVMDEYGFFFIPTEGHHRQTQQRRR